jgi:hypothetical protein
VKASNGPIHVAKTSASESLEGERKTVTAIFADIMGWMELSRTLTPEEARAIGELYLGWFDSVKGGRPEASRECRMHWRISEPMVR